MFDFCRKANVLLAIALTPDPKEYTKMFCVKLNIPGQLSLVGVN